LFADEPTGNLDTKSSHDIMTFLSDLNREHGITVVLVTHEDDVAQFARRTIRFVDGRLQPEESRQKALV
ncbi:MAG: macrolide ABC transporter ATP-binding protein, partial [Planctomycetota bacterium]